MKNPLYVYYIVALQRLLQVKDNIVGLYVLYSKCRQISKRLLENVMFMI